MSPDSSLSLSLSLSLIPHPRYLLLIKTFLCSLQVSQHRDECSHFVYKRGIWLQIGMLSASICNDLSPSECSQLSCPKNMNPQGKILQFRFNYVLSWSPRNNFWSLGIIEDVIFLSLSLFLLRENFSAVNEDS